MLHRPFSFLLSRYTSILHINVAAHNELGRIGEEYAIRYLLLHGWHLLAKDWHAGHVDIDIVATKLGWIIFVEVKTRSSADYGAPEEAVDGEKETGLLRAAHAYLRFHKLDNPFRFDIISLTGTQEPFELRHIRNAFDWRNAVGSESYEPLPIAQLYPHRASPGDAHGDTFGQREEIPDD